MKVFVAASFSTKVDYETGEVFPVYKEWIEKILNQIEAVGHEVYCSLRHDQYKINDADPVGAYKMDMHHIDESDVFVALVDDVASSGVQVEIGYALAAKKKIYLAHEKDVALSWYNATLVKSGDVEELIHPFDASKL